MTSASNSLAGPTVCLLKTLFSTATGAIQLWQGQASAECFEVEDITSFLKAASIDEEVRVSLVTADGFFAWCARYFDDEASAAAYAAEHPDLALETYTGPETLKFCFLYRLDTTGDGGAEAFESTYADMEHMAPFPDTGGWVLTEATKAKLAQSSAEQESSAEPVSQDGEQPAPEAEAENLLTYEDHDGLEIYNIAALAGEEGTKIIQLPLQLGMSNGKKGAKDINFPVLNLDYGALANTMRQHKVGPKEGSAIIQGIAKNNERSNNKILELDVMGLDIDNGLAVDEAILRVRRLGLTCVGYTTHSHMKTVSTLAQAAYVKWAQKAQEPAEATTLSMRRYLREVRHWLPEILATVAVEDLAHEAEGISYRFTHAPIHKFRLIFPLASPFNILARARGRLQNDAINDWRKGVRALAKHLDMPIDESCLDPARLFYLPRHSQGAAHRSFWIGGKLLDFDGLPIDTDKFDNADEERNFYAEAAKALGVGAGKSLALGDFNLRGWFAQNAPVFMAADAIRARAPAGVLRTDKGTDKIEIKCPFDDEHSDPGDENKSPAM